MTKRYANKEEWMLNNGFSADGYTWIAMGDTFAIKDELKAMGCKFNKLCNWHLDREFSVAGDIKVVKFAFDELYVWSLVFNEATEKEDAREKLDKIRYADSGNKNSSYFGQIAERLRDIAVTVTGIRGFESLYGYTTVYTFEDIDSNEFTWFTSSSPKYEAEIGEKILLTGTVKDHKEFRGTKQTILTRCIMKGV